MIAPGRGTIAPVLGLIDFEFPSAQTLVIQSGDGSFPLFPVSQRYESKTARLTRLPVMRTIEFDERFELGEGFAKFIL